MFSRIHFFILISFLIISLLLSIKPMATEDGRPLNAVAPLPSTGPSLNDIMHSGPSPRGVGHRAHKPALKTVGNLRDSGPSPGVGHKSVAANHHT